MLIYMTCWDFLILSGAIAATGLGMLFLLGL
jgi:hypothetical protein